MATNRDYDDDIFTLKEDEAGKRRSHMLQYALVSLFAVAVIAVAIYMSWWLTERRKEQNTIAVEGTQTEVQNSEGVNAWPEAQFPNVPVLASAEYKTYATDTRAEINVPMATAAGFEAYAQRLADDGAQIYVQTPRLTVLNYHGTEIHLIASSGKNAIELCKEPKITWNDAEYAQFPLPQKGQLVDVSTGTGEGSRVLTYRQLSASDAIAYVSNLISAGWAISGSFEPQDHVFAGAFRKNDLQISVDYFSTRYNCTVKLDFIQQQQADAQQ